MEPHQNIKYCNEGTSDCHTVEDLVLANNTIGDTGFRGGDSGGPVYALISGSNEAQARGMVVAGNSNREGYYDPTYDVTSLMGVNHYLG